MNGIITLNSKLYFNFGCLLQSYALQMYLKTHGYPAEAIYCPSFSVLGACRCWVFDTFRVDFQPETKTFCVVGKKERMRNAECTKFIEFAIRPRCYTRYQKTVFRDIVSRYDKLIVGSDQVWNPNWAIDDKTASTFFLSFAPPEKRFSYAASFGAESIPVEKRELFAKALKEFNRISVREDAGKKIVEELTGRTDVEVLADPTLLLTREQWNLVEEPPREKLPQKYLLTYFLGHVSEERRQAIEKKAAELGCESIWLMDKDSPFYAIGPQHFLHLIHNARMVCTDSFHGSVFSFLYEKPLAIFEREGSAENMSSRIRTLVDKFHLEACLVKDNEISAVQQTDYSAGYAALEEERLKTFQFLQNFLR